ncbi:MAG: hypothetical protein WAR02_16655, partial [Pseudolabrys sp.]
LYLEESVTLPPRPSGGSTEPSAAEETLVRSVLLDIGSLALFRCIGMMFMLDQLVIRDLFSDWRAERVAYGSA